MKRLAFWIMAGVLALAGGSIAWTEAFASGDRSDCPGKIECPLTGELVCADRCPLAAGAAKRETAPSCCPGDK